MSDTPKGTTSKSCTCRDPDTGRRYGVACPRLKRGGRWSGSHGTWRYQLELPRHTGGSRRTLRRSGFATETTAIEHMDAVRALLALAGDGSHRRARVADLVVDYLDSGRGLPTADVVTRRLRHPGTSGGDLSTVGVLLEEFLLRRSVKVSTATARLYAGHVRLYLAPYLGHIPPEDLTVADVAGMFEQIEEFNDTLAAARASKDPAVREAVKWRRPVGATTKHRIRATLRTAYNMFIREQRLMFNPATHLELPPPTHPTPMVWTDPRVAQWRRDHQHHLTIAEPHPSRGNSINPIDMYLTTPRPSPVMVWTPQQAAVFLDHARSHHLYALYRLILLRGLRRGEATGLRRANTDTAAKLVDINWQITQLGWTPIAKAPKSAASNRTIGLDDDTATALAVTLIAQDHAREAAGTAWTETGYVFTDDLGRPWHPQHIADEFHRLAFQADLPPIQLHGARHTAACLMHAAGADIKDIQATLGHSSVVLTGDTYTTVFHDHDTATAQNTAALIDAARLHPSQ